MDEHLICFIICVTDALYKEECLTYLNALEIPPGYATDVITIEGAESVCTAYNAAMRASDAKYKVYLRQNVFIRYPQFLAALLEIFTDETIGMIGLMGTEQLSEDGVLANGPCVGGFSVLERKPGERMFPPEILQKGLREVMAVDGRLIATQVDLPWREDLFGGEDFYDAAQSLEYRKAGYRVVVPAQCPAAWYIYDTATEGPAVSETDRETFLAAYAEQISPRPPKPRILSPNMKTISSLNLPYALALADAEVLLVNFDGTPEHRVSKDIDPLSRAIRELHADAVMTHDYYVPIAEACAENHTPYISWIYDSIQIALYDESTKYPTNYIFDFDRLQAEDTRERGAVHVKHMPLAANVYGMEQVELQPEDETKYSCDVSFIGSLYSDPDYQLPMDRFSGKTAAEVQRLLDERLGVWDGEVRFADRLSEEAIHEMSQMLDNAYDRKLIGDKRYIEETWLSRGITHLERMEMLRRLGKLGRDVRLFTRDREKEIRFPGVIVQGELEYGKELPKAYYFSRINLNLTLPSIRSGIPLRVFDVMAAGGFLLTNYQPEIEDLFVIGQDLEVFHSFEEMEDKVGYYLKHERERLQITLNGHRKVREKYSYEDGIQRILHMVFEDLRK